VTGDLVGIDMNMLLQLMNTFILYFLLRHFLFRPVSGHLAGRQKRIESDLRSARDSKKEMEKLKKEYQKKLDAADEKAAEIIAEAARKGEMNRREIIEKAKAEARDIYSRAQRDIQLEKEKALAGVRDEMVNITMMAAERVLEQNIDSEKNRRLVRDFVDRMGSVS